MNEALEVMLAKREFEEAELSRPFEPSELKRRQGYEGRWLDYIEGHKVVERLNQATGNRWSCQVHSIVRHPGESLVNPETGEKIDHPAFWSVVVSLTIPSMGTRTHVGTKAASDSFEDDVKAAVTDGVKKAATLFGIALYLYGEEESAAPVAASAPQPPSLTPVAEVTPEGAPSDNRLSEVQRRAILALAPRAQLGEAELKQLVIEEYSKELEALSRPEASQLLGELQRRQKALVKTRQKGGGKQ